MLFTAGGVSNWLLNQERTIYLFTYYLTNKSLGNCFYMKGKWNDKRGHNDNSFLQHCKRIIGDWNLLENSFTLHVRHLFKTMSDLHTTSFLNSTDTWELNIMASFFQLKWQLSWRLSTLISPSCIVCQLASLRANIGRVFPGSACISLWEQEAWWVCI